MPEISKHSSMQPETTAQTSSEKVTPGVSSQSSLSKLQLEKVRRAAWERRKRVTGTCFTLGFLFIVPGFYYNKVVESMIARAVSAVLLPFGGLFMVTAILPQDRRTVRF